MQFDSEYHEIVEKMRAFLREVPLKVNPNGMIYRDFAAYRRGERASKAKDYDFDADFASDSGE